MLACSCVDMLVLYREGARHHRVQCQRGHAGVHLLAFVCVVCIGSACLQLRSHCVHAKYKRRAKTPESEEESKKKGMLEEKIVTLGAPKPSQVLQLDRLFDFADDVISF